MPTIALPRPALVSQSITRLRHPAAADLLMAAGLTAVGVVTGDAGALTPGRLGALVVLAAPLPLLLLVRRRYPVGVCTALAVGNLLMIAAGYPQLGGVLAFAVALYTLGAHRDLQVVLPVGFLLIVGAVVGAWFGSVFLPAMGRYWDSPEPTAAAVWPLLLPLGLGVVIRQYRLSKAPTPRERALEQAGQAETERRVLLEERAAIARDLHDSVAHHVNLMVIQAETGPDLVRQGGDAVLAAFRLIGDTGRRALAELDRTLAALREGSGGLRAPQPRLADLPALVEDTAAQGLAVELITLGDARAVDAGVELAVYRIVQESLTNVMRHANAGSATVTVEYARDGIAVQVADRGRGFDPAAPPDRTGHGLAGVRERARVHGGTVAVASAPGAGTVVSAWLPDSGSA